MEVIEEWISDCATSSPSSLLSEAQLSYIIHLPQSDDSIVVSLLKTNGFTSFVARLPIELDEKHASPCTERPAKAATVVVVRVCGYLILSSFVVTHCAGSTFFRLSTPLRKFVVLLHFRSSSSDWSLEFGKSFGLDSLITSPLSSPPSFAVNRLIGS
uniref:Uncharacterized protein n=1 Tax=Kalanchoe fedtschenkoi TaxID=63787 RepID=A0A7N0UCB8_KALFE